MQIVFSDIALQSIRKFFQFYEDLYFRLYDDTWLWPAEEVIKKSYQESAYSMRHWVYSEIKKLMSHEKVLWYVPWDISSDIRLVTKSYWSYRLFVEYREIDTYRVIENVRIYRK